MKIDKVEIAKNKNIFWYLFKDLNKNNDKQNKLVIANILDNPVILGVGWFINFALTSISIKP